MNLTPSVSVRVERVSLLDPSPGFVPGISLPMTHEDIVFNRKGGWPVTENRVARIGVFTASSLG